MEEWLYTLILSRPSYIPQIRLFPNSVDGVEAINYGNHSEENEKHFNMQKIIGCR